VAFAFRPIPSRASEHSEQLARLVCERLDAHSHTERLVHERSGGLHWRAHLSYLVGLQRLGAGGSAETDPMTRRTTTDARRRRDDPPRIPTEGPVLELRPNRGRMYRGVRRALVEDTVTRAADSGDIFIRWLGSIPRNGRLTNCGALQAHPLSPSRISSPG
jgi:hypothetical protein